MRKSNDILAEYKARPQCGVGYCRVTGLKRMATERGSHMLFLDCITSDECTKETHWGLMCVD